MKLPPDFPRTLQAMTDDELCQMLAAYEDYLPEAIEAARAEFDRRKLPPASVVQPRRRLEADRTQSAKPSSGFVHWLAFHTFLLAIAFLLKACS